MASGIWTSASGATAQAQNLDVISNNLANSDTGAYKKDVSTFKEYLATVERQHDPEDIPRGPIKDKDFYPLDGRDQSHVILDGTHTLFKQGNLRVTQRELDVALDGPGFLELYTPNGIRYTRDGSLKVMNDGRLVTSDGFPILGVPLPGTLQPAVNAPGVIPPAGNPPLPGATIPQEIASRFINLRDKGTHFTISATGEIYAQDNLVGRLNLVEFQDMRKVKKMGGQLFVNVEPGNIRNSYLNPNPGTPAANPNVPNNPAAAPGAAQVNAPNLQTIVRQGVLETSNVNPIEEMTNMIRTNRNFEQDLKAMKTYGEMLGREVNDIGKL